MKRFSLRRSKDGRLKTPHRSPATTKSLATLYAPMIYGALVVYLYFHETPVARSEKHLLAANLPLCKTHKTAEGRGSVPTIISQKNTRRCFLGCARSYTCLVIALRPRLRHEKAKQILVHSPGSTCFVYALLSTFPFNPLDLTTTTPSGNKI